MAKVRIYEIANELKIQSKDVIEFLKEKNIFKKTASSSIEDDVADMAASPHICHCARQQPGPKVTCLSIVMSE